MAAVLELRRRSRPGRAGWSGCLRSVAWIEVFSSTDSTIARSGRFRYSPQMSRTRSQNVGSSRRLSQPRTLVRSMSIADRIRHTWDTDTSTPSARSAAATSKLLHVATGSAGSRSDVAIAAIFNRSS